MTSDKPRMMKALVSRDHKFRVQEIPRPALREGELLLQVTACGVCFSDVHKIRFQPLEEPVVLGHEVAGRVVESESATEILGGCDVCYRFWVAFFSKNSVDFSSSSIASASFLTAR